MTQDPGTEPLARTVADVRYYHALISLGLSQMFDITTDLARTVADVRYYQ